MSLIESVSTIRYLSFFVIAGTPACKPHSFIDLHTTDPAPILTFEQTDIPRLKILELPIYIVANNNFALNSISVHTKTMSPQLRTEATNNNITTDRDITC